MASFLLLVRYSHGMFRQGKDFFREDLSKWHGLPRKGLIRTDFLTLMMLSGGDLCKTRDLMLISHQSHLRLITTIHKSKLTISTWKKIWIVQSGSGLDKRQCTLQIMTCAKREQTQIFFFLYTFCTLFLETCSVYFQVMFDQVDSAGRKRDA